jgi:hypothetical protein
VALTPDYIYSFKVAARNSVGLGEQSLPVSIRAAEVPFSPASLSEVPVETTAYQVGLTWEAVTYDGGSAVLDFTLSYRVNGATEWIVWDSAIVGNTATVTGLTPGTYYDFMLQARNIVGLGAPSEVITVLAAQMPDAPTNLENVSEETTSD